MKDFLEYVYIKLYLRYVKGWEFDGFIERYTFVPAIWATLILPYLGALLLISVLVKKEIFGQAKFVELPPMKVFYWWGIGIIPISLSLLVVRTGLHDRIMNKAPKYETRSPWVAYFFLFSGLILLFSVFFLLVCITNNNPNYKPVNH